MSERRATAPAHRVPAVGSRAGRNGADGRRARPRSRQVRRLDVSPRRREPVARRRGQQQLPVLAPFDSPFLRAGSGRASLRRRRQRLCRLRARHGPCPTRARRPEVTAAVAATLGDGQLFAGQHRHESALAELLVELVPSAELVRFGLSGSEMVQLALRVARAATGRQKVVKFEGHYHGWFDTILVSTAPPAERARPPPASEPRTVGGGRLGCRDPAVERSCRPAELPCRDRRSDRRADHGADPLQHLRDRSPPGLPGQRCVGFATSTDRAHLRRGDHRLPSWHRRCPGSCWGSARPDRVRESHSAAGFPSQRSPAEPS